MRWAVGAVEVEVRRGTTVLSNAEDTDGTLQQALQSLLAQEELRLTAQLREKGIEYEQQANYQMNYKYFGWVINGNSKLRPPNPRYSGEIHLVGQHETYLFAADRQTRVMVRAWVGVRPGDTTLKESNEGSKQTERRQHLLNTLCAKNVQNGVFNNLQRFCGS